VAREVIDDKSKPESVRAEVQDVFNLVEQILCYYPPGEREIVLVPMTFHVKDYYQMTVEQYISELPDEVKAAEPLRLAMAWHAAKLIDNQEFSTDLRLDMRDALEEVIAGLQRAAADVEDAEDADPPIGGTVGIGCHRQQPELLIVRWLRGSRLHHTQR
jgi:hypothetical protein